MAGCMHLINCLHVHQLLGGLQAPGRDSEGEVGIGDVAGNDGRVVGVNGVALLKGYAGASTGLWKPLGVRTWVGEGGRGIPSFNGTPTRWFWRDAPLDPPGSCGPTIVGEALRSLPAVSSCTPRAAALVVLALAAAASTGGV